MSSGPDDRTLMGGHRNPIEGAPDTIQCIHDIDPAMPDNLSRFIQWSQTLAKVQEADEGTGNGNAERSNVTTIDKMMCNVPEVTMQSTVTAMQGMNDMVEELDVLNLHEDQLHAYVIITHHLAAKQ